MHTTPWDKFFNAPYLGSILEEAFAQEEQKPENPENPEDKTTPSDETDISKLADDFKKNLIDQDDLINMYKSGKLSKEDIKQIVNQVETEDNPDGGEEDPEQEGPSEEELIAQQIEQTNDLFIKFTLYDKINEVSDKLDYFEQSFSGGAGEIHNEVTQLREFLRVLSSLIFNIETPVAYQMYGNILLRLTELFEKYVNENQQTKN